MKKIILFIGVLLVLSSTSVYAVNREQSTASVQSQVSDKADMTDYENFDDTEHRFVKSSMEQVLKLFSEGGTGIVYFGYPKCPWCIDALPVLNNLAKKQDQDILYVQTRDNKKKLIYKQTEKRKLIPYASDFMRKDSKTDSYELFVPFVLAIKDGKAVAAHIGTLDTYDVKLRSINSAEEEKLTDKYKVLFDAIN